MGLRKTFKTFGFLKKAFFTKRPRIGYVGGYQGHGNLGDEALYAALKQLFSRGSFIDYGRGLVPHSVVRHLPKSDLMLMGGGTLVGSQKESSYQWTRACFSNAPQRIIFGSGVVSPDFVSAVLKQPIDIQKRWADIIRTCDYVGVRGPLSRAILEDWGIHNAEIIGDPVLSLARSEMPAGPLTDDNVIGLNVGQSGGYVWGSEEYICQQFVKLAQIAAKAGYRLRWFVVWPQDLSVTREVVHNSDVHSEICEIYDDYEKYLDMVSRTKVFVGMKLHAVALATCAYVPSVMLEYNPKCRDYMDSIGQGENTLRTDRFTAHQAWELANNLLAKRSSVVKSLFETITKFRKLQSSRASQISINLGLNYVSD